MSVSTLTTQPPIKANKAGPLTIDTSSNNNLYTTLRQHCLSHATTPPRHIRCGVRYLIHFNRMCKECAKEGCTRLLTDEEMELRVEASIHCMGLPVHGDCISTHRHYSSLSSSVAGNSEYHSNSQSQSQSTISWDDVLVFPCRWKDLTRDACITFNVRQVVQPSHRHFTTSSSSNKTKTRPTSNAKSEHNSASKSLDCSDVLIGGTTLHLFNEKGLLRTGKLKLQLYPSKLAVPRSIFSSNDPDATPGLAFDDAACRYVNDENQKYRKGYGGKEMERADARWHAMSVLDVLGPEPGGIRLNHHNPLKNTSQHSASVSNLTSTNALGNKSGLSLASLGESSVITSNTSRNSNARHNKPLPHYSSAASVASGNSSVAVVSNNPAHLARRQSTPSWLDTLTRQRCHDIIEEEDRAAALQIKCPLNGTSNFEKVDTVESILSESMYLIVELPTFSLPVVFEEVLYPYNQHAGSSGSVTALDLALFKRRSAFEKSVLVATAGLNKSDANYPDSAAAQDQRQVDRLSLGLVQLLDPEHEDDNPVEDKYRTLARDLLRGLVDPALKPDRVQSQKIAAIIASPSHHLTREEQDLLWRFRFSLVDNRKALTKFLLAVDWTMEAEVVQAAELLAQWRNRSPIEVTDALKLLGKHVAFQTNLVRSYAIDTLARSSDAELSLYLLQLVQALKYEDMAQENDTNVKNIDGTEGSARGGLSSLASFLIDRASRNYKLANYLYWYLKVELQDEVYGKKYRAVYLALEEKLCAVPLGTSEENHSNFMIEPSKHGTMWDILLAQDSYISDIMEAQIAARASPGKRDAKVTKFRELLFSRGLDKIPATSNPIPLPSTPEIMIDGINPTSAIMFKSALYPALVEFCVGVNYDLVPPVQPTDSLFTSSSPVSSAHKVSYASRISTEGSVQSIGQQSASIDTYKVIVKTGDDLRQDQLVMMMIRLMDGLLKRSTLDLCLRPYSIIATHSSPPAGLVEYVEGSLPVSQVLSQNNYSILKFLQASSPSKGSRLGVSDEVMQNYVRSCAGYCVITYILGVGDRHLDNIMLLPNGQLFHIDFGYIFGNDPKPLPPPFRITKEMVEGMGGNDSPEYRLFCSLAGQAYNVLRRHAGLILNLLHLMSDAGIEHLPSENAERVIQGVEERLRLELTDEQAEAFFLRLIGESLKSLAPRVMEFFHGVAVSMR